MNDLRNIGSDPPTLGDENLINILLYGNQKYDDKTKQIILIVTMKHVNRNCIKESAKLLLKDVTQIKKNLSMRKRRRTLLNYLLNTGSWQIRNLTYGCPGV